MIEKMTFGEGALAVAAGLLILFLGLRYAARERLAMDGRARAKAPGQFAELSVGKTHWLADGPDTGDVVVLVPGATLPLWIWRGLPEKLAAAGYRVIRYDLLGRGYSDRPRTAYNSDLFDRQLLELLAALQIAQKVHLVGLAFGCPIISTFANRHPDKVRSLCFIGPDGFGVQMGKGARLFMIPLLGPYLFNLIGTRKLLERIDDYSTDDAIKGWLRARYAPELEFKGFKQALISSVRNMPIHDSRDSYSRADASFSITAIWGDRDHVTPMPGVTMIRQVLRRADIHILPDVGHLPHHERFEDTAGILLKHLSAQQTAPAH
jgi:pimeloyl-ACP methyl ester carboxylesterase